MFSKNEIYKFIIIIGVIIVLSAIYLALTALQGPDRAAASFEDCVRAGNPVMESYPRQCRTEDGRLFVEEVDEPIRVPEDDSNDREIPRENDREDEQVPITSRRAPGTYDGCVITGCSGQVCAGEEVVTTCEFRPEYTCYEEAVCERQTNGECGWTNTDESKRCLAGFVNPSF